MPDRASIRGDGLKCREGLGMSQAPSMPLFVDAFIADTTHLTPEEVGAYMRLLMSMWRHNGSIPDDDKDNARITGTGRKWKAIKERLRPMLDFDDNTISQKRLQKEWTYVATFRAKQREKGIKSGEARRNKNKDLAGTTVPPRLEPQTNPHTHTHTHIEEKKKPKTVSKKGTRLPDDWQPGEQGRLYAASKGLTKSQTSSEAEKFRNYWHDKPGQGGVKISWDGTWRNWCITAAERMDGGYGGKSSEDREYENMKALL